MASLETASSYMPAPLSVRKRWQDLAQGKGQNLRVEDVAIDRKWQYPAITEQHAFERLRKHPLSKDVVYFAFPWATLIDQCLYKPAAAEELLADLMSRSTTLRRYPKVVTVCQHVQMREFLDIMTGVGITDVFWSHTTQRDMTSRSPQQINLHPFPLYPVQFPELSDQFETQNRPFLFSFIGSYAPRYYLSESRNHIIDTLRDHPSGQVIERREWHYSNVVYGHQIHGEVARASNLVDEEKSSKFRDSLLQSTFSLCPSGSGPNSIRLWESIGAGSIPVILADTWAPPGDRRLWDMAAVFCDETPEAIKALPDRLAQIAAEPGRLAQMRHAMRQLWLLYGPQNFVNDVQEFLLAHCEADAPGAALPSLPTPPTAMSKEIAEARHLLLAWSSRLLLDPAEALAALDATPGLPQALERGSILLADSRLPAHFRSVLDHARNRRGSPARLHAPSIARGAVPTIAFLGRHSHRTPLSHAPIRRMVGDRLAWAGTLAEADLVITGYSIDWRENIDPLLPLLARSGAPKLAVMSEEPRWDVTGSDLPTGRDGRMRVNDTEIRYAFLSHETSDIFRFDRLPYFVLTADHYAVRYASMMSRFVAMTPAELLKRWQSAPIAAAFFAAKSEGDVYVGSFPDRDVTLLSGYRSQVAALSNGAGVLRVGKGWGAEVGRQDLPDWHLDKMAQLDGRVRMASAFENVHQHNYISEKIFDAFAVGGVPVYWASPKHRIFDLVPATAMLNTVELDSAEAAKRIADFTPDLELAESWLETCSRLADLFGDFQAVSAERRRVADAVVAEVLELV